MAERIADVAPRGYQVLFELGRGGMGAAFLARAEGAGGFERLVVIKRIRPERVDPRNVERFLREAKVAAAIHHANVVSAQNVGEDAEGPFIVLDYVDGASLEELLDRGLLKQRAMPVPVVLRIALDTLAGLGAVHDARDAQGTLLNVLHRDVSLQNILVGKDGVARLLDFGIARSDLGGATTDQRYLVGKLPYLPPEYLQRQALTAAADVYGLGVTLWLALTGRELWPDASEAQVLQHILSDGIPPLSSALQVAPEIVDLVGRACTPTPKARFGSAREMAAAIETLGRENGWLATHHEVAEWVNELCGVDLQRKRERIAMASTGAVRPAAPSALDATLQRDRRAPAGLSRKTVTLLALAAAVAVIAMTAWALTRAEPRPPGAASQGPNPLPALPESASPPQDVKLAPEPTNADSVLPTLPAPPAAPRARQSVPASPASGPAPVRPPNQISKRNPYRD